MHSSQKTTDRRKIKLEIDASFVRRKLLAWYDRNKRDLPWRSQNDPYRIWISEIMLQQTRVQAVIPYYENFLRNFPDVQALAIADDEKLLTQWSGLGYYSRARNLKLAAQKIVREHNGKFPEDHDDALALPGIGEYTAAAVLSIGYGVRLPVLDGNVARVLSRLAVIDANTSNSTGKKRLLNEASRLLSLKRPGDFNQAMMELGAVVCVPENPKCDTCPLKNHCRAFSENRVTEFPPPKIKVVPTLRRFVVAIVMDEHDRCLLVQRPQSSNWMKGFWELPMEEVPANWDLAETESLFQDRGWILERHVGKITHSITTNRLEINICKFATLRRNTSPDARSLDVNRVPDIPITTVTRKALRLIENDLQVESTRTGSSPSRKRGGAVLP